MTDSIPQEQLFAQTVAEHASAQSRNLSLPQTGEDYPRGANRLSSPFPLDPLTVVASVGTALDQYQIPPQPSPETNNTTGPEANRLPWSKALNIHLRALRAKEKAWGVDHLTTLDTAAGSGRLYASRGYIVEADEMYRRAVRGYKAAKGRDHPRTQEIARARDSLHIRLAQCTKSLKENVQALHSSRPLPLHSDIRVWRQVQVN